MGRQGQLKATFARPGKPPLSCARQRARDWIVLPRTTTARCRNLNWLLTALVKIRILSQLCRNTKGSCVLSSMDRACRNVLHSRTWQLIGLVKEFFSSHHSGRCERVNTVV